MGTIDPGAAAAARAAMEAARRAAEAAAKRAAEAAKRAAEAQAKQAAKVVRPGLDLARSSAAIAKQLHLLGSPDAQKAPPSTLLTEDSKDGSRNCLDAAADWLDMASPQIRAKSEALFLRDTRPGAEGQTGHVVIRQGESIFDPSTGKSYPSLAAFNAAGSYQIAGVVSGAALQKIMSTPPNSPERQAAIDRARVPASVATMLVADNGPTGKRDVSEAFEYLREGWAQNGNLTGAVQFALKNAAGNPELQANIIALLQGTPADQLTQQISQAAQPELQEPVPNEPAQPSAHVEVGGRVDGNALDAVIGSIPAADLGPALAAAKKAGTLTDADIVQGLASPQAGDAWMRALTAGGINPLKGNSVSQALAEVQAAQKAYQSALDQRAKLDQRLAADLKAFGPYLTPKQQQDYILKFRQDHKDEYAPIDAAAQKLDDALLKNKAQLDMALQGPEGAKNAKLVFDSYKSLANSPNAQDALNWALTADQAGSAFAPFAKQYDLKDVTANAMPNAMAAYIQKHPDVTPADAIKYLDGVTTAYLAQQGFGSGSTLALKWKQGIGALVQLAGGDAQGALSAIKSLEPKLGMGFAALGMVVGLLSVGDNLGKGDLLKAAWAGTFTAQQTVAAGDAALKAIGLSSMLAEKLLGKLTIVANILDAVGIVRDGVTNGGQVAALAGDAMGILGGAMMAGWVSGPGEAVVAAGAVLYVVGMLASDALENGKVLAEQRSLLERVGVDPDRIMTVWQNVLPPDYQLPTGGRGLTALLMAHDPNGMPIVFDAKGNQTLVFDGMTADGRIKFKNPYTGESGSMSQDELFSTVEGVHVDPAEVEKFAPNYRPPTPQ